MGLHTEMQRRSWRGRAVRTLGVVCLLPLTAAHVVHAPKSLRTTASGEHHHGHHHRHEHHHGRVLHAAAPGASGATNASAVTEQLANASGPTSHRAGGVHAASVTPVSLHSTNSSFSTLEPPADSDRSADADTVARLEAKLSELVAKGESASPDMKAFTDIVRALLENDLKPKILSQSKSGQSTIDVMASGISDCASGKASLESDEQVNLASRKSTSKQHKDCRLKESRLFKKKDGCGTLLRSKKTTRKVSCGALVTLERDPYEMAHNCKTTHPPEPWGLWLKRNRKWFEEMDDRWEAQKLSCRHAKREVATRAPGCARKERAWRARKGACDSFQDQLETAACTYAQGMSRVCRGYDECYQATSLRYEKALPYMKEQEKGRKSQWRGIMRIDCLLGVFDAKDGGEAKVQECKEKSHGTSHLDLRYPAPSSRGGCAALPAYPGDPSFEQREYKDLPRDARSKAVRSCLVSAKGGISLGKFPGSPSSLCDTNGDYLEAVGGGSCLLATRSGKPLVIDYTKARYTTYRFTVRMKGGSTRNNDISPHVGFDVCNKDGESFTRGRSPEFWFIDRDSDWGYGTFSHADFGIKARYTDKSYYGVAEPHEDEEKEWEITMEFSPGIDHRDIEYQVHSWTVQGVSFDKYKGVLMPCPGRGDGYAFTPRIWAYKSRDKISIKDFQALQGESLGSMIPIVGAAVAP